MRDEVPFRLTVLAALALIWAFPYLPLLDLPQHAAQITALHDLLLGRSPWAGLVRINLFTPYLIGYLPAVLLSFALPVTAALKLVMSAALLAWLGLGIRCLRHFGALPALRWILLPSWFGFVWQYGFFTFMAAAPLILAFLPLADRYARNPNRHDGLRLALALPLIYAAHALAFYFAALLTATLGLAWQVRSPRLLLRAALAPLAGCLLPALATLAILTFDPQPDAGQYAWGYQDRLAKLFMTMTGAETGPLAWLGFLIVLALPWCGSLNRAHPRAAIPILTVLAVWFLVPSYIASVGFIYHRFSLFVLPFAALLIAPPALPQSRRAVIGPLLLMALSWAHLGLQIPRYAAFQTEMQDFWQAMARVPERQRLLYLIDGDWTITQWGGYRFEHMAAWYQAERQGWVDFNFAVYRPQIVRYRPPLPADSLWNLNAHYRDFSWQKLDAGRYDAVAILHPDPLPPGFFRAAPCGIDLLGKSQNWTVVKPRLCPAAAAAESAPENP